jgi:hypothetical protein
LSGTLPTSIGNIGQEANKPVKLFISGNNLSGSIPNSIGKLPLGSQLHFSYNEFTFAGMELVAEKFSDAKYAPQELIAVHQNGNTLSVSAGGTLSNNTYTWFRNGSIVSTITGDSVFHPTQSGEYRARVTNSIATELILFSKLIYYEAPNESNITSVENTLPQVTKRDFFEIYPNPAKVFLYVQTNYTTSVSLLDQSGKILLTATINGKSALNISNLSSGLYYLKNNNTQAVQEVVISR